MSAAAAVVLETMLPFGAGAASVGFTPFVASVVGSTAGVSAGGVCCACKAGRLNFDQKAL